jgi:cyclopropane fatty-acyl-phospholipid synthase-like methyltransferase
METCHTHSLTTYSISEACERNKDPILRILTDAFAHSRKVLEIGSGTGQHAVHFATNLPHLTWQPTDRAEYFPGLRARVAHDGPVNLKRPIELDVKHQPWPVEPVDAVFTANTLHIMDWSAVESFVQGLHTVLTTPGILCIYGPFRYAGKYTSESNAQFDTYLKSKYAGGGLRDLYEVNKLMIEQSLHLLEDHAMPANNQLIVWAKRA